MGKTSVVALRRSVLETPTCQHHWLIEAPEGPTSKGFCKRCGTEREFLNSLSADPWDYRPRDDLGRGYVASVVSHLVGDQVGAGDGRES